MRIDSTEWAVQHNSEAEEAGLAVISQQAWWRSVPRAPTRRLESPSFAELLRGRTLVVLSRAESAMCMLSEVDGAVEVIVHRIPAPMGLAYWQGRLAVGCAANVCLFSDIGSDGEAAFLPLSIHATGAISVHDLAWDNGALWVANTLFSTICTLGVDGLRPCWKPSFIGRWTDPDDACHLNGMVIADGAVVAATALAATGDAAGWRSCGTDRGVVLDARGAVRQEGLSLPHSPLTRDGRLFLLESGRGRLVALDSSLTVLAEFPGVARGLAASEDALFIARSPVRTSSGSNAELLARRFPHPLPCGLHVCAYDGTARAELALPFLSEIASLHLLPYRRVSILRPEPEQHAATYVIATPSHL